MSRSNHQKLRVGIVGAGDIVRIRHLPGLKKHSEVDIVAVSNSSYESAEKFCQENAPQATPMQNWADLLSLPDLDIVWIGTPPYMHSAITLSALEAGKHVFCQARMSMDLAEAEEMLAASKRYPELVTMLCPPPFGLRGDLLVKKLLAENYIGRPHHIRLQCFTGAYLNAEASAHWRQRAEISGLNVLALGIYVEVLQRWFGDITGVYARGKVLHEIRQGYEVSVPDLLNVLCTFENGAEGVLEFSGIDALAGGDRLEAYGELGTMTYDFGTETIQAGRAGDVDLHAMEITPDLEGEWRVEDDFIAAVKSKGRVRPLPDFEEGLRYMRVVQAVADSRALNEWVAIKR
ncbi:MAG TPA: Gfo/Idh/MocA family oxidoreductase [Chthoniobacterales bacterium]|nr:Gfo/Idh/MocA family oxidoreductase [Chthoniobacterales bacterium]